MVMDPPSNIGITSATITFIRGLLQTSLSLQSVLRDIKHIDDTVEGILSEIEAFRSILLLFEIELRSSELMPNVHEWWDADRLEQLFASISTTFSRLEMIGKDVGKQRVLLVAPRQYWKSKSYDREITHLRLRIGTYITSLQIPIQISKL
jgi:hypothetical protein